MKFKLRSIQVFPGCLPTLKGFTRFFCVLFSLISFVTTTHAQLGKEANYWYFGTNAGIQFNGGPGPAAAVTNGAMIVSKGCSSISDNTGSLLFYTDGRTVWNRSHVVMGNGTGLSAGNSGSSTQGALIVKQPGNNPFYYIFTTDEQGGGAGLRYSVVDMSLNATMGGVILASRNTLLYTPTTEKLTAVKHCNGKDVWILTHESNTNTFKNYLLTSAGLNPVVNSSVGTSLNVGSSYAGQMKVSPTGAKVAFTTYANSVSVLELLDFNNVTGVVTSPLSTTNHSTIGSAGFGVEFSPNGQYLYVSDVINKKIYQYIVCSANNAAFAASKALVGTSANPICSMQLGPDKKIYCARANGFVTWLGVINSPNLAGALANYVDNGVSLSGKVCQQGLPGFVQSFFRDTFPIFTNVNNCLAVNFTSPPSNCANPINAWAWNFGETSSGSANTSTQPNPSHTYTLPGNYTVRLILNCVDTLLKTITVTPCPLTVTSNNSAVCPGICASVSALVSAGAPGYTYTWNPNIGNGAGPYNVCPTQTTIYTVTVTDLSGATAVSSSTVTVHPATIPNAAKTDITCNGSANGTASVAPGGGTPAYRYLWSTSSTNASISNLTPATYTITITDANNCTARTTVAITQPVAIAVPINVVNISCNGGTNGTATANPTGGTGTYSFLWSNNSQSTQTATGLTSGLWTVTVTDANGCKATGNANITQPATAVTATLTPTNVSCFNGTNGVATAVGGGGTPGYTYSWAVINNTNASVTGLSSGGFSVTVTDSRGCTFVGSLNITQPATAVTGTVSVVNNVSCFNGNNGKASVIGGGGTPGYTYAWSNGPATTTNSNLQSGLYTATVTDSKGCTFSAGVNITQPATSVSATVTVVNNVSCKNGNNGVLTVNAGGGSGGFTYLWSQAGATAQSISNLVANTYSVTVTDINGCTMVASATVTEPNALVANSNIAQHVSCYGGNNGSASIVVNGGVQPFTYAWTTIASTSSSVTTLASGSYTITVTDNNGCTTNAVAVITQPAAPLTSTVNVVNNVLCFGGNSGRANVVAGGGTVAYVYSWSNGQQVVTATGLSAGIVYTATVTDSKGCVSTSTTSVTQPAAALTATATVTASVTCFGGNNGSVTVAVNGGAGAYSYLWTPSGKTTQSVAGIAANTFSVLVTDINGCTAASSATINQPGVSVTCTVTVVSNVLCKGGTSGKANVAASGGAGLSYGYLWSNNQTTTTATGLSNGTYSVVVTDGNGCTSFGNANITEPLVLATNPVVNNHVSCFGGNNGSTTVNVNGGTQPYTYSWAGTTATTSSRTNLTAGSYTATVTDFNGCTSASVVSITQPIAPLTSTISVINNVSCFGGNNGSAKVAASGGTLAYTYSWSNAQAANNTTGLSAGIVYTATITDSKGCVSTSTASVTQPAVALTATASVTGTVSCFGGNNGSTTVAVNGGTSVYTYSWIPSNQITQNATGLSAGSCSIIVTDANGCTATDVVNIAQPATAVSLTITVTANVSCNGGSNGAMSANASGGNPGYTYVWWNNQSGAAINGLPSGPYTATVVDANGCTSPSNANITQPALLTSSVTINKNVSCFGGNDGAGTISAAGGTTPYNYTWKIGAGTVNQQSATNLTAGVYNTTVTDALGCVSSATVSITEPIAPLSGTVSVINNVSCFGGNNGSAKIVAGGGTQAYTYSWSNTQNVNTATGLSNGPYTVTVTDANGCTYTDNVNITEPATAVSITVTAVSDVSCNGGNDGSAQLNAAGGTGAFTYSWSTTVVNTNTNVTGLTAGSYSATVTDANGCTAIGNINITEPPPITVNISLDTTICIGGTATLTTGVGGGKAPYNYLWSTTEAASSITASPAITTTYSVLVTDANNCTSIATVSVIVSDPVLVVVSGTPGSVCVGQTSLLSATASGGIGVNNYTWNNYAAVLTNTMSVSPANTTVYTVSVSNTCGVASATVEIAVNQLPAVTYSVDDPDGCPQHCVSFSNTTANANQLAWAFGDGGVSTQTPNVPHCYDSTGVYTVTLVVTDMNGCTGALIKNNYITVYPEPIAKFIASPQETSILAPSVQFTEQCQNTTAWAWCFGDNLLSTSSDQNPKFDYNSPGTYKVQLVATNDYGCTPDTAWLEIIVKEDYVLYVPNTFTPNGDELNDIFRPVGMGIDIQTFEMWIFDRWGDMIFKTNNIDKGWNGHAKDGNYIAQQDTYVWKIRIVDFMGNNHALVGHINLIR